MQNPDAEVAALEAGDIEAWLNQATPDEVRVSVCMNRQLLSEFDALITELDASRPQQTGIAMLDKPEGQDELLRLQERLVELKRAIEADEKEHTFVFRKGDYYEWRELLDKYPPTDQQKENFRGLVDHDIEAAQPAVVAFACVSPKMTEDQATRLRRSLPEGVWGRLYDAALRVNRTGTESPNSVMRIVDRLDTELKSTSRAEQDSPSRASADASSKKGSRNGRSKTSK